MKRISQRDIANALNTFFTEEHRPILFGREKPYFWARNDFPVKVYKASPTCQFVMSIPYIDDILINKFSPKLGVIYLNDTTMASIAKSHVLLAHRFDNLLAELDAAGFTGLQFGPQYVIMYQGTDGIQIELTCDVRRTANPSDCKLTAYANELKNRKLI